MSESSGSIISNLVWRFAERCGAQGVSFLVSVVLARILAPEVYGTIALVTVFTAILQVFVDSGLGNALIQKKDADDLDYSSVFWGNMFLCICLYIALFFFAPKIADFYNDISLIPVIRVMGLTLIISGLKNMQQAYVSKKMIFKKFFFATLGGTFAAAFVGIGLALRGFGVWALVAQNLVNKLIDTCVLWLIVGWHPRFMFSFKRLKGLVAYGWKILVSSLLDTVYNNIRQLVIGRVYTSTDLAYYNKGKQMPNLVVTNINTSIDSVLFPVMSKAQESREEVKNLARKSIRLSSYIMCPIMVGLAVCAEPLVRVLLTDKWVPCVWYLRIFCFSYVWYPVHTANLNAIKAVGRSDIFLKLEVAKKVIGLLVLALVMNKGTKMIAGSLLLTSVVSSIINAFPNKKLINYGYQEQIRDILPATLLAVIMGVIVWSVTRLPIADYIKLIIMVPFGAFIYFAGSKLLKLEEFESVVRIVKRYIKR
ncbi:MAG: lipopolysaccharide biosynthesis protein [Eubacteriales bacterium]|nr:lipopolysaccharide biosynthesis protein [Eubacteriales bacterium]